MPVYNEPPRRTWGQGLSDAMRQFLQYYLLSKRAREDKEYRERKFGIEEALAESQGERNRAMAQYYSQPEMSIGNLLGLARRSRNNKILGIGGTGKTVDNPMAVYGEPGVKPAARKPVSAETQGGGLFALEGYEKPSITIGSRGQISGMTFRPQTTYPEGYGADLKNAVSAIDRGADRYKVYQRIAAQYPQYSTELKRILLYTTPQDRMQILSTMFGIESE